MKCVLVVLLTHASGKAASAFSGYFPMTGLRRRGGFSAFTALSCGALHPILFFSPTAAMRTMVPQEHDKILIPESSNPGTFPEGIA